MSGHLDVDALLIGRSDVERLDHLARVLAVGFLHNLHDAREHQVFVRIFVIDDEEAVLGGAVERDEADIVIVVAELASLGFWRLVRGIELRRIGKQRIAPAQQHVGIIAVGDVMGLIDAGLDFRKGEGRASGSAGLIGRQQRQRADRGRDGGHRETALQKAAPGEALRNDLAHRRIGGLVVTVVVGFFQLGGREHALGQQIGHIGSPDR